MTRSLSPRLLSFDVFGTLISVRDGSYGAFRSILADAPGGNRVDVKEFFEYWEQRNIAHYWEPYRRYKDIATLSLAEAFTRFDLEQRGENERDRRREILQEAERRQAHARDRAGSRDRDLRSARGQFFQAVRLWRGAL